MSESERLEELLASTRAQCESLRRDYLAERDRCDALGRALADATIKAKPHPLEIRVYPDGNAWGAVYAEDMRPFPEQDQGWGDTPAEAVARLTKCLPASTDPRTMAIMAAVAERRNLCRECVARESCSHPVGTHTKRDLGIIASCASTLHDAIRNAGGFDLEDVPPPGPAGVQTRCKHVHEGSQCCQPAGHDGQHYFKCAGPYCPGLWPVAVMRHPTSCTTPPPKSDPEGDNWGDGV